MGRIQTSDARHPSEGAGVPALRSLWNALQPHRRTIGGLAGFGQYTDDRRQALEERELRLIVAMFERCRPGTGLWKAQVEKVVDCIKDAKGLGLELGGAAGECAIVVYGSEPQLVVEYPGKVKLMLQHPLVQQVTPQLVYELDEFDHDLATDEIHHRRPRKGGRGDLAGAYCRVALLKGGVRVVYMDVDEIYAHGLQFSSTAWVKGRKVTGKAGFEEKWWGDPAKRRAYCLKTVIHQVAKTVPRSPLMTQAMFMDERAAQREQVQAPDTGDVIEAEFEAVAERPAEPTEPEQPAPSQKTPPAQEPDNQGSEPEQVPFPTDTDADL